MKSNVFSDAVESSAKVFGRKDVRVVFEGSQAHTDGNMIVLPALPASADITIDQADVIRGYRDHESMHVRCTDTSKKSMDVLAEMSKRSAGLGHLIQYCEDIRIEHAGVQEYPGMKHSLSAVNTEGAKGILEQMEATGDSAAAVMTLPKPIQFRLVLQQVGRSAIGVESDGIFDKLAAVIKVADPKLHALASTYGKRMAELPTGYKGNKLNETASKKGTAESFALAEEIYKAYGEHEQEQAPPPPPPQPQPDQPKQDDKPDDGQPGQPGEAGEDEDDDQPSSPGEPGDEPQDGDGDGSDGDGQEGDDDDGTEGSGDSDSDDDGGGQGDDATGEDQADDSSGDPADGGQQQGQQDDQGNTPSQSHSNGMDSASDDPYGIDDVYQKALQDTVQDISNGPDVGKGKVLNRGMFSVWSSRFSLKMSADDVIYATYDIDGQRSVGQRTRWNGNAMAQMDSIDKTLMGKRSMIRRILELELQARNDRKWVGGHKSGRLQSVRLVDAIQGRETVYQKREDGRDMDTILHISIDGSGSMAGSNALEAITLAYALSEALERTGCDIVVEMWGSRPVFGAKSTYTQKEYDDAQNSCVAEMRSRKNSNVTLPAKYVSFGLLTRGVIKSKRQRTTSPDVRKNFGLAIRAFNSGTPTYHAVFSDLKDLSQQNHAKKIYLHITDGDADFTLEDQRGDDLMKEAHTYANSVGVHMIGVGISGMRVSHLFTDSVEVNGPDAYEPVIRKLAKLVAQEAGHAAQFKRAA